MNREKYDTTKNEQNTQTSFIQAILRFGYKFDWYIINFIIFSSPVFFLYMCITPSLRIFAIMYLIWMYYDRETPHTGGRRIKRIRKLKCWQYRRDYFPIKLVKTAELPPDTTYVFGSFPHGMWVIGASTNFLSDVNNFDQLFPELNPYVHHMNLLFWIPFVREILLSFGTCGVSSNSIQSVLNGPAGNVSVITVGGYAELQKSSPGSNRVVLNNRKGFVRMALKAGSSLVPVYTFGEPNMYDQLTSRWYVKLQEMCGRVKLAGEKIVFFLGFGPIKPSYLYGILPYQRPLTTVVGKPIKLPKVVNPQEEMVDKYHEIFKQELISLFEENKATYDSQGEKASLNVE